MFERYNESARRALFFARAAVASLGGSAIGTDHLLLGVLRAARDVSWRLCAEAGVTYERARVEIGRRTTSAHRDPASVEIPFSRDAKQVLEHAAQEADRLLHSYIGTEHLLLGLLHGAEHPAAAILSVHGMKLEAVRDDVVRLLNQRGAASPPEVDTISGAVSSSVVDDRHDSRFERLRGLIEQLARSRRQIARRAGPSRRDSDGARRAGEELGAARLDDAALSGDVPESGESSVLPSVGPRAGQAPCERAQSHPRRFGPHHVRVHFGAARDTRRRPGDRDLRDHASLAGV